MTALLTRPDFKAGTAAIEQIYVTHCLHGEGAHRQAGFNIRACSTQDALLHRFALEYPHYVLPAGTMADDVSALPRRLALVRIPGGQSALIHSVFLPDAGRGRANNFFSHILILPAIPPHKALAAWGSPEWVTSSNRQDSPELLPLEDLPTAGPVNDAAVTAFLQRSAPLMDGKLGLSGWPERLSGAGGKRRGLLRLVLRGCQLALQQPPTAARCRFYILAEPELTALLLYAAARLLPQALAATLTFSTYEHARRDLRLYKHARVIGTCLAAKPPAAYHQPQATDQAEGFPKEFYTARGYALDTFRHEFSNELTPPAEKEIEEWLDLAAQGDWDTIDQIHGLLGTKSSVLVSLAEARQAFRLSQLLAAGQAGTDDLFAARRSSWGPAILDRLRDKVWPIVRDGSLTNDRLREEFAELLELHVPELEQRLANALQTQSPTDWQPHWRLLQFAVHEDATRLWEAFHRVLPEPPYAPDLRVALLQELHRLQLTRHPRKLHFHRLLKHCDNADLVRLAESSLDRRWLIRALCYALLEAETMQEAVRQLHGGDAELVRIFWEQLRLIAKEALRRQILAPLFPASEAGRHFLSRSLKAGCSLPADTWDWLLDKLGAWQAEWRGFWMTNNHLGRFLNLLKGAGDHVALLWQRLSSQINENVLVPGDAFQKTLLLELVAAKDQPGGPVPRSAAGLTDWSLLREHFEKASGVPETDRRKILDACQRCRIDAVALLAKYFQRFILVQGFAKEVLDDFLAFFHSFCPPGEDYQDHGCRLLWWLRIVECCPDESAKAAYQRCYLEQFVPFEHRWRLAEEAHQSGKLLGCVYESLAKPTERGQATYAASAEPSGLDEFFQLTGLHALSPQKAWSLAGVGKRLLSLVPLIVGAAALAILCYQYRDALRRTPALALFMPAVYALAAGLAVQSAGLALRDWRGSLLPRPALARQLGGRLLIGLILGVASGVSAGGLAALWGESSRLALCVGITAAGGIVLAEVLGWALPLLLRAVHWESRIPAGWLAPPACGILALLLYLTLARWLLD
jgi:hypothetical protein